MLGFILNVILATVQSTTVPITVVPATSPTPNAYSACLTPGCANTGPRVAVGPQSSITCPTGSVSIAGNAAIQTVINAHSAGTTYCLSGTFTNQTITSKAGDTYIGSGTNTVLDGTGSTAHAFAGTGANVTVENLTIENYVGSTSNDGAISVRYGGGTNWMIRNNIIQGCAPSGVAVSNGSSVVANIVHDNLQNGILAGNQNGTYGSNITITDNVIYNTNTTDTAISGNEGGVKSGNVMNLNLSYNYSYNNHGPGLWDDVYDYDITIDKNDVENNYDGGITHEISYDAEIANNYTKTNQFTSTSNGVAWCPTTYVQPYCAEIFMAESGGYANSGGTGIINVFNNKVIPGLRGGAILFKSENRTNTGELAPTNTWSAHGEGPELDIVENLNIHNNFENLAASGAVTGGTDDGTYPLTFTQYNNVFNYNTYTGASSTAFEWNGATMSFATFRSSYGQEVNGTSS